MGGPSPNDGSIVDKPHNFLRLFLPSVYIDGGRWPHPFFTFDLWCSRDLPSSNIQHLLVFEYNTFSRTFIFRLRLGHWVLSLFPLHLYPLRYRRSSPTALMRHPTSFYAFDFNISRDCTLTLPDITLVFQLHQPSIGTIGLYWRGIFLFFSLDPLYYPLHLYPLRYRRSSPTALMRHLPLLCLLYSNPKWDSYLLLILLCSHYALVIYILPLSLWYFTSLYARKKLKLIFIILLTSPSCI